MNSVLVVDYDQMLTTLSATCNDSPMCTSTEVTIAYVSGLHCIVPGQVLDRVRKMAEAKQKSVATMLDTKGPEIRTAMLRDHKPIELKVNGITSSHVAQARLLATATTTHHPLRLCPRDRCIKTMTLKYSATMYMY